MPKTHTPLVIANWKMNPKTVTAARNLFTDIQKSLARIQGVDVVVAPPTVFLAELAAKKSKRVALSAQNVFWELLGARTGETSPAMLKSLGVTHVIIGHSERRALGETDEAVNKKVHAVIKNGQIAVVCVGEQKRDEHGKYLSHVEAQVRAALAGVPKAKLGQIVVAYEPIWAIGTGDTATPQDAHEMKLFIQKTLSKLYGRIALARIKVLYGGSVKAKNAEALMEEGAVDGFLVGGASLRASEFTEIVKAARS